jgi:hypothetical protein
MRLIVVSQRAAYEENKEEEGACGGEDGAPAIGRFEGS